MPIILTNCMTLYSFIFSNKTFTRILRHTCFWIARYIYGVMIFLYFNSNIQSTFWLTLKVRCIKLLFLLPFDIVPCYLIIYWLIPHFLLRKKYTIFIGGLIFLTASSILLVDLITLNQFNFGGIWQTTISAFVRGTPVICMVFIIIKMLKTWYQKEQEKDMLIKENFISELQLLKAQVHPHFLFNTMNNIYYFIITQPEKAKSLIKKLEKILRYMIHECDQPTVYLSKEINMINDYFELEKVRYDNLDIDLKITGNFADKMIAPLLMIPFIENSFKHGSSKMLKNPWIKLFIQADEEMLHFSLVNSKPSGHRIDSRQGIGLNNVKRRLALLYPNNFFLNIEPTENTFTVDMQIPLVSAS